ncbi:50S ribosomal protein L10 [Candidatus Microgenomates bacterium]|nr:MAG: 50S ribosomal protein L10 [Candidatus Microgenomates bacterium]
MTDTKREAKEYKKQAVDTLETAMKAASSVVFVDYTGMSVKVTGDFRDKLRETSANVAVAKNTFIKIAGEKAGLPADALTDEVLSGQTAIVFANEDAVFPIQVLGKFARENELPKIKGGVVEGSFQNSDGIIKISKLPSKQELYAQVVGSVASPMYGIVGVLNANMQKLVYILSEASKNA